MILPIVFSLLVFADSPDAQAMRATELVQQLGDASFRRREAASKELQALGAAALSALESGLQSADKETVERCKSLLPKARDLDFGNRIERFLGDPEDKLHIDLPGWKRFAEHVGKDAASRQFFAAMAKEQSPLLRMTETDPKSCADMYFEVCTRILRPTFSAALLRKNWTPPSIREVAALMLAESDSKVHAFTRRRGGDPEFNLGYLLSHEFGRRYFTAPDDSPVFRKLVVYWIDRQVTAKLEALRADPTMLADTLEGIRIRDLKDALPAVVKALEISDLSEDACAEAICTIGALGDTKHVELLKPFLKSEVLVATHSEDGADYKIQVRDIALGVSIKLAKQDPKAFDYPRLASRGQDHNISDFGFRSDKERANSLKKWEEYKAKSK